MFLSPRVAGLVRRSFLAACYVLLDTHQLPTEMSQLCADGSDVPSGSVPVVKSEMELWILFLKLQVLWSVNASRFELIPIQVLVRRIALFTGEELS